MKIELTTEECRIVIKALRNRTEDLTRFADDAERKGHKTVMVNFLEMANANDAVSQKIQEAFDAIHGD